MTVFELSNSVKLTPSPPKKADFLPLFKPSRQNVVTFFLGMGPGHVADDKTAADALAKPAQ